jgi:hypothetical protein
MHVIISLSIEDFVRKCFKGQEKDKNLRRRNLRQVNVICNRLLHLCQSRILYEKFLEAQEREKKTFRNSEL